VQGIIVALLEHMSRGIEDSTSMPNRETMSKWCGGGGGVDDVTDQMSRVE